MASVTGAPTLPFFFYGTLMSPAVYKRVVTNGNTEPLVPPDGPPFHRAVVRGYCRRPVKGCDYPAMVKGGPQHRVEGMLCYVPSAVAAERLDVFEGDEYERIVVQADVIGDGDGGEVSAYAYIWAIGSQYLDLDREWDFQEFVKNKLEVWVKGEEDRV